MTVCALCVVCCVLFVVCCLQCVVTIWLVLLTVCCVVFVVRWSLAFVVVGRRWASVSVCGLARVGCGSSFVAC